MSDGKSDLSLFLQNLNRVEQVITRGDVARLFNAMSKRATRMSIVAAVALFVINEWLSLV